MREIGDEPVLTVHRGSEEPASVNSIDLTWLT